MDTLNREVGAIPAHVLLTRSPFDLIDPARAAAAARLEQTELLLWILAIAVQIGVLAWFWSSGNSAAMRDRLRVRLGNEFRVRFVFGAFVALLDKGVALMPLAAEYRVLFIMGQTEMLFRQWLAGWVVGTVAAMSVAGALAAIVLWLADRTHQWYVYALAAIMAGSLLTGLLAPSFASPPLSAASLSRTLLRDTAVLEKNTGASAAIAVQRLAWNKRSSSSYVSGIGPTQRIVLPDTLLTTASEPELRFVIARALAWIAAVSSLHLALIQGAMIVLGAALAVTISDRIGFRRDDDPVSRLALLGAIIGVVYLAALPFYNAYSRNLEIAAARSAIAATHDPASAVRLEVRRADSALVSVCPAAAARWYLFAHPSPGQAISIYQNVSDVCR